MRHWTTILNSYPRHGLSSGAETYTLDADEIQSLPNPEGRDETMTVKRYRKKPVVIKAIQFAKDRNNEMEVRDFLGDAFQGVGNRMGLGIATLEGPLFAAPGDYIIKGVTGEFYPCKPHIFALTYEEVGDAGKAPVAS